MEMTQTITRRGDLSLLDHPAARELLQAAIPARLAYIAPDGTPRAVPVLFHWTGDELVVGSWPDDFKVEAIQANPQVAVTIDTAEAPFKALMLRCEADVEIIDGAFAECLPTFTRYMGPEAAEAQLAQMRQMSPTMARIALRPTWVDVIDFQTRLPAGIARRVMQP
jgi:hypothetical protein